MDHRRDFEWLVMDKCGKDDAQSVEWSALRLICIAGDFTKYDVHAVNQMNRNIELIRYRRFSDDLLLLDLLTSTATTDEGAAAKGDTGAAKGENRYKTVTEYLAGADEETRDRYEALRAFLLAMGDDVQERILKFYIAFRRIKNFACVEIRPQKRDVLVYVKVDPQSIELEEGFTRNVRKIGHYGTGDLEITISSHDDVERAKSLLIESYEAS